MAKKNNVVKANFISVWDDKEFKVPCKVNLKTKEVFGMNIMSEREGFNNLNAEYLEIQNKRYPVECSDGYEFVKATKYWYAS